MILMLAALLLAAIAFVLALTGATKLAMVVAALALCLLMFTNERKENI